MKLSIPFLTAALSAVVTADEMLTYVGCNVGINAETGEPARECFRSRGVWYDDWQNPYNINSSPDCRNNPGPPGIASICIDWNNSRLKFYPSAGGERCLRRLQGQSMFCALLFVSLATGD
jgi:hypothetical protein